MFSLVNSGTTYPKYLKKLTIFIGEIRVDWQGPPLGPPSILVQISPKLQGILSDNMTNTGENMKLVSQKFGIGTGQIKKNLGVKIYQSYSEIPRLPHWGVFRGYFMQKTLNEAKPGKSRKSRKIQKWILVTFFSHWKKNFVFEKIPNIFWPANSLVIESLRNVKKSQIGPCLGTLIFRPARDNIGGTPVQVSAG